MQSTSTRTERLKNYLLISWNIWSQGYLLLVIRLLFTNTLFLIEILSRSFCTWRLLQLQNRVPSSSEQIDKRTLSRCTVYPYNDSKRIKIKRLARTSIGQAGLLYTGEPNDVFPLNALKKHFRLSRVLSALWKCILSSAIKFVSVRSSQGNLSLFEITRASVLFSRKFQTQFYESKNFSDSSLHRTFESENFGFLFLRKTGKLGY